MASAKAVERTGVLILCLLSGLTVGYFVGELCRNIQFLNWMNYAGQFGLDTPVQVNLGVIWFSLQIKFNLSIASIFGLVLGVFVYRKL